MNKSNQSFNKILVIKLQHHGDILLTTPVIHSLKSAYPNATIDVLLYKETLPMLQDNPLINNIFYLDRNWKQQGKFTRIKKEWQLGRLLQKQHYDLVIDLADQWKAAIFALVTQAPMRLGLEFEKRKESKFWAKCHNVIVPTADHGQLHTVEQNLSILTPLNIPIHSTVTMSYSDLDKLWVEELIKEQNISNGYIVIQPTSRWFFKCWDEDKMASLISLFQQNSYSVILTSGPEEKELKMVDNILAQCPNKENITVLAGKTSLPQLAALIDHAKLFIGVDSVAMHMAAALKTPLIALFGPSKLKHWHPWQAIGETIWAGNYADIPHPDHIKTDTQQRYLSAIPVDVVFHAAKRYLTQ
ncbi:putative lipopolysaccharide heptosyltransferase III [Proteus hauseri]|uniref:putative lipopolysaccharide heptosyltransferase III n=1 Tax=Proteus hauseri TaxID=183417 RepID=UPI0032DB58B8